MIIAVALGAGCGAPERGGLERFPVPARVVCEETISEVGATRRSTSIEECRREGDRVRCDQTTIEGDKVTKGWGEERVDAAGHWALGNEAIVIDPPALVFPADIAPGKRWTVEVDWVMRDGGERTPIVKTHEVVASDECEGGLRLRTSRQAKLPGASRTDNDLLFCPGAGTAREYTSNTIDEDGPVRLVRSIVGRCRVEASAPADQK